MTSKFGKSTGRLEDQDLLRGKARFVNDIRLPGMLYAVFVRSPHAHARIVSIDKSAALALPGVIAVLSAEDIRAIATTDRLVVALPDKNYTQQLHRIILAADETVYVGEAIAMVVANDPYVAEDAAILMSIDFEVLPAVSDCRVALQDNAPSVHSDAPSNLVAAFSSTYGDVDTAFAGSAYVFGESYWTHRGCSQSMEGRGCVASYARSTTRLLSGSTQTPVCTENLIRID